MRLALQHKSFDFMLPQNSFEFMLQHNLFRCVMRCGLKIIYKKKLRIMRGFILFDVGKLMSYSEDAQITDFIKKKSNAYLLKISFFFFLVQPE